MLATSKDAMSGRGIRVPILPFRKSCSPPSPDLAPLEEPQGELAAVRTRIERTNRLIDQVVYRLYGLTEEEIVVVERTK
jgi:hypothetical protein